MYKHSKNILNIFFKHSTIKKQVKMLYNGIMDILFYVRSQTNCKQNGSKKTQDSIHQNSIPFLKYNVF